MKILLVLILFLKVVIVFGQLPPRPSDITKSKDELPDGIKSVRQYTDNQLINVREYDLDKKLIFSYYKQYVSESWNGKYIIMINGYIYDNSGKLQKSYQLHSNIALTIRYHEYDSLNNNLKIYVRDNNYEFDTRQANKNQFFRYVAEITTLNDLFNHPKIKEIEEIANKYLYTENSFDIFGNLSTETTYGESGDTLTYNNFSYDTERNVVHLYSYLGFGQNNRFENIYEYQRKSHVRRNDSNPPEPKKIVQEVGLSYHTYDFELEPVKRVSVIIFYNYDKAGQLIEKVRYHSGSLNRRQTFEYNNIGQVVTHRFFNDENKLSVETGYSYNEDRYISKEIKQDFRTGERTIKEYYYEFEYHK